MIPQKHYCFLRRSMLYGAAESSHLRARHRSYQSLGGFLLFGLPPVVTRRPNIIFTFCEAGEGTMKALEATRLARGNSGAAMQVVMRTKIAAAGSRRSTATGHDHVPAAVAFLADSPSLQPTGREKSRCIMCDSVGNVRGPNPMAARTARGRRVNDSHRDYAVSRL